MTKTKEVATMIIKNLKKFLKSKIKVFSERWIEDCRKCSGLGKLIMKTNENGK